jgi:hypothetical protein
MYISNLCMHKDIDLIKQEVNKEFGIIYERTLPIQQCYECKGIDQLCKLYYPLKNIRRDKYGSI